MKKITGKLSLQWRLTLITALLMTVTCILMYFFISQSAVAGMEDLGDYMIRIDNTDSAPITFNMNPSVLFPELSNQLQLTKKLFLTKGLMVTGIIILLSSICTYFISRQALLPLRRLSQEVNKIEAQNLSKTLEVPATNDEISRLTISFNKMLARLDEAFTAQKQFSANAAHELRTPLAVIQTNLEVFARRETPALKDYQEIFAMLQEQTGRLSHLAEILLDMTGVQTVERSERISLAALTDEVFCDLASVAEQKDVELIQEGFVREIISKVQTMRKEAGFEVMDKILVYAKDNDKIMDIMKANQDEIKREVLAENIILGEAEGYTKEWNINKEAVTLGVSKVQEEN